MAKPHDKSFKLSALQYRKDHLELSIAAVCRNLGISEATYYKWANEFKNNETMNHQRSNSQQSEDAKEIARLKRELEAQKDALRILKKAISILGEEPK